MQIDIAVERRVTALSESHKAWAVCRSLYNVSAFKISINRTRSTPNGNLQTAKGAWDRENASPSERFCPLWHFCSGSGTSRAPRPLSPPSPRPQPVLALALAKRPLSRCGTAPVFLMSAPVGDRNFISGPCMLFGRGRACYTETVSCLEWTNASRSPRNKNKFGSISTDGLLDE